MINVNLFDSFIDIFIVIIYCTEHFTIYVWTPTTFEHPTNVYATPTTIKPRIVLEHFAILFDWTNVIRIYYRL